jgi:hypothetical protein
METKRVIELEPKQSRKLNSKLLVVLSGILLFGFALLLVVGFENILALFRYRVALFLVLAPLLVLFLWCAYKAFGPKGRS